MNTHPTLVTMRPLALSPAQAAEALGLSLSQVQKMTQAGEFPKPRQLSAQRVGYVVAEVEAWLSARPPSGCLPPAGSGYGRAGNPGKTASAAG